jgi:NTP pyrophosphatase (non-canonical NTP hydrolase)
MNSFNERLEKLANQIEDEEIMKIVQEREKNDDGTRYTMEEMLERAEHIKKQKSKC